MLFEQRSDGVGGLVLGLVELQSLPVLVLADEIAGRGAEQVDDLDESGAIQGLLQVFDDVELDAALAQDFQRAA